MCVWVVYQMEMLQKENCLLFISSKNYFSFLFLLLFWTLLCKQCDFLFSLYAYSILLLNRRLTIPLELLQKYPKTKIYICAKLRKKKKTKIFQKCVCVSWPKQLTLPSSSWASFSSPGSEKRTLVACFWSLAWWWSTIVCT